MGLRNRSHPSRPPQLPPFSPCLFTHSRSLRRSLFRRVSCPLSLFPDSSRGHCRTKGASSPSLHPLLSLFSFFSLSLLPTPPCSTMLESLSHVVGPAAAFAFLLLVVGLLAYFGVFQVRPVPAMRSCLFPLCPSFFRHRPVARAVSPHTAGTGHLLSADDVWSDDNGRAARHWPLQEQRPHLPAGLGPCQGPQARGQPRLLRRCVLCCVQLAGLLAAPLFFEGRAGRYGLGAGLTQSQLSPGA